MYSRRVYISRRRVLCSRVTHGVILLLGNNISPRNYPDNGYPFRQDSSFLYYLGIQAPRLAAVMDVDADETILFGDEWSIDEVIWRGNIETVRSKAKDSGISETQRFGDLLDYLEYVRSKGRPIHFLPQYTFENKVLLGKLMASEYDQLVPSEELILAIIKQRSIKQPEEIREIKKALFVTRDMHLLAMRTARPDKKEYEIVSAMKKLAMDDQCTFAYPSIFTINGEIIHNHDHRNTLKEGRLILNDTGAESPFGYAADITRTFPVAKEFTTQQREIYEIVLKALEEAQKIMKPGVNYKEVHKKAAVTLVDGLINLGLMKGNAEEAVAENAHTLFFQTGAGHMLGLDVHDMEALGEEYVGYTKDDPRDSKTFGWKSLRLGRPLEEGFVVTVEPGIYFIPELIDIGEHRKIGEAFINYNKVYAYRKFGGVRIEDDFLITDDGYRNLSRHLATRVEDIEELRKEAFE